MSSNNLDIFKVTIEGYAEPYELAKALRKAADYIDEVGKEEGGYVEPITKEIDCLTIVVENKD
jgi:hypothetical protein